MKRFFEFLLPERTHLKAVIAALVAIFLLSGVLAYQVHRSQAGRKDLEEMHIQAFQQVSARALADNYEHALFNHLRATFFPAITVAEKGGTPDSIAKSVVIASLCFACEALKEVQHVSFVDLHSTADGSEIPISVRRSIAVADTPNVAPLNRDWVTGILSAGSGSSSRVYAYMRYKTETVNRAWFVTLPNSYLVATASIIAHDKYLPGDFTNGLPLDSVFRVEAHDPAFGMVTRSTKAPYAAVPAADSLETAFFPGLIWTVGVLPRGRDIFIPPVSWWLSPNLLVAMMVLIASVIMAAIALVRREEELHRLRSDLISGVSHELRTPLAQIRMFAETLLLGRTRTEAERRRSLEVIDQEAKRLSHFVENMLQFAKGEGGRTRLVPEPTSFAIEVRRAVETFAPMCQARGVDVRTELEDGVTAPVDRAALRRIMLNLMENALKYGPDEQRITVGIAIFNDVVRLWVDDEGEGIPRLDRERVFDSFYRLNRELDRRVTGSGIGLAVVRQLATLHGGRAWAEEAPGGGARLVVEFPDAYVRPHEEGTGWAVA